jgi:hypothetical protein
MKDMTMTKGTSEATSGTATTTTVAITFDNVLKVATAQMAEVLVDLGAIAAHPDVLVHLIHLGVKNSVVNAYHSPGKDGSKAEKEMAALKRVDAWLRGETTDTRARGETIQKQMESCFVDVVSGELGKTKKALRDEMAKTFAAYYPPNTKFTFEAYVAAIIGTQVKASGEDASGEKARGMLVNELAYWEGEARKAAEVSRVTPPLDLTMIKLRG